MEDSQKTRGLLIGELEAERRHRRIMRDLLQTAEYAFTNLPFDHAQRRQVLRNIRTYLQLDPERGSAAQPRTR